MHSFASHRARIIATPTQHAEPAAGTPPAQLSRQAALFRRLREGAPRSDADADADAADDAQATPSAFMKAAYASEHDPSCGFDAILREPPQQEGRNGQGGQGDNGGGGGGGGSGGSGADDEGHASDDGQAAAQMQMPMQMQTQTQMQMQMQYAAPLLPTPQVPLPAPSAARRAQAVSGVQRGGMHRLFESIVAEVAEFCANPVVVQGGNWQITIPIDPALLPECTLSLALSHFQLTLRFETTLESSRQLISTHVATLRANLEQLMQNRLDGTRGVEIIVT